MDLIEANVALKYAVKKLLKERMIKDSDGPPRAWDYLQTKYTGLELGGEHRDGCPQICYYTAPCQQLVDHFVWVLDTWLAGRHIIVWRTRPSVSEDLTYEIGAPARELIEDGLAPPGTTFVKTVPRFRVYCRLTAYGS